MPKPFERARPEVSIPPLLTLAAVSRRLWANPAACRERTLCFVEHCDRYGLLNWNGRNSASGFQATPLRCGSGLGRGWQACIIARLTPHSTSRRAGLIGRARIGAPEQFPDNHQHQRRCRRSGRPCLSTTAPGPCTPAIAKLNAPMFRPAWPHRPHPGILPRRNLHDIYDCSGARMARAKPPPEGRTAMRIGCEEGTKCDRDIARQRKSTVRTHCTDTVARFCNSVFPTATDAR